MGVFDSSPIGRTQVPGTERTRSHHGYRVPTCNRDLFLESKSVRDMDRKMKTKC
jgi:hypothetical protein